MLRDSLGIALFMGDDQGLTVQNLGLFFFFNTFFHLLKCVWIHEFSFVLPFLSPALLRGGDMELHGSYLLAVVNLPPG